MQQTFIAAYPRHNLIQHFIDFVVNTIRRQDYGNNALDITGPYIILRAYNDFFGLTPPDHSLPSNGTVIMRGRDHANYKIKLVFHKIRDPLEHNYFYLEENGTDSPVIKKKFGDYPKLLQKHQVKYHTLWNEKNVFNKSCHKH